MSPDFSKETAADGTELTVGEAAEFLGVTARTLRYWDHIGLLTPSWRTWSDHRLYTQEDLRRGLTILIFRSTGMPLKEVSQVLSSPDAVRGHLVTQRRRLQEEGVRLREKIRAVDNLLKESMEMNHHSAHDAHRGPGSLGADVQAWKDRWDGYYDEAESRWGETPEWQQSHERTRGMTGQDWAAAKAQMDAFVEDLLLAQEAGVQPGSDAAGALVRRHAQQIERHYPCTIAKQVLLARMYVADERFAATYRGAAPFLLSLVEAEAVRQGADLNAVSWDDA